MSIVWMLFIVSGIISAVQVFLEPVFSCDGNESVHTGHQDRVPLHILGSFGNICVDG